MSRILASLVLFFLTSPSIAKSIVVGGFDYEPYYFSDGTKGIQGACYTFLERLCSSSGLTCKFKIMPFRTALESLKSGKVDIVCPLADTTPRRTAYYFSGDIFPTAYGFYGLEKNIKKIKRYEDLVGKTVTVFGPSNTEVSLRKISEFLNHKIKIELKTSVGRALKTANANQADLAYANVDTAKTWIERNRGSLQEVPNLRDYTGYRIAFSKQTISKEFFDKIQESITELKKSKELRSDLEKYNVQIAE